MITNIKTFLKHYQRFKKDQKKFKYSKIGYYNFWALSKSEDCWFTQFIESRNINFNDKKISFFSVFGSPYASAYTRSPKIFFTGENIFNLDSPNLSNYIKSYIKNYDLSLGFNYSDDEKFLRFPLWILYLIPPDASFETIKNIIDTYNDSEHRLSNYRQDFCVNISRFDTNGIRNRIIQLLNPIHQVSCAGSFMKNTDDLQEKFSDNKIEYLKTFKFNICPENSDSKGYVTEKLFESIMGGSIPIYWGSNNMPEITIINQDAVLFFEESNPEKLFEKVNTLWNDEKAYEEFCKIKPFRENAAEEILQTLNELENKIKQLL